MTGIDKAIALLQEKGARRALKLNVGGAFHSPLMEPARVELEKAIQETKIVTPVCPDNIQGMFNAQAVKTPDIIKANLIAQLTSPVRWTQTMKNMIADGMTEYIEVGPGKVLQGLLKKVDRKLPASSAAV